MESHVIYLKNQTVTCYEHTDETIVELVKRYYEGKYGLHCKVVDASGRIVYESEGI